MPIYAYRCAECGHAKDVLQKMSDAPLRECPACGAAAFTKQVTAAGFQLKGSGWYVTDFRGGAAAKGKDGKDGKDSAGDKDGAAKADAASPAASPDKAADKSPEKSADKKSEATPAKAAAPAPAAAKPDKTSS